MSFSKSVQKIIFLAVMTISAVILCLVGVWAAQSSLNLKFTGLVNPDILCSIHVTDSNGNTTTLFDNHTEDNLPNHFLDDASNLKNFTTTLDGSVASRLDFTLTNYTPTKNIRLSIASITINGNPASNYGVVADYDTAVCPMTTTHTTDSMRLNISASQSGTLAVNLSLVVEEVYKITAVGTGLASAMDYYFSPNDTVSIPLVSSVGYQLPNSVVFSKLIPITGHVPFTTNISYSISSNLSGNASCSTDDILQNNVYLTCDCEEVFKIYKNNLPSLLENGFTDNFNQTTATIDPSITYLPNNGEYDYVRDSENQQTILTDTNGHPTVVTNASSFKEYPYYITLGNYPQTLITDSTLIAELNQTTPQTQLQQTINKTASKLITWHKYQNEWYVKSDADYYDPNVSDTTGLWFKVEPIVWIVIGAEDASGNEIDLNTLYFQDNMFYIDQLCGKPFAGRLLLMSALALDTQNFASGSQWANFGTSSMSSFLLAHSISNSIVFNDQTTLKEIFTASGIDNYIPQKSLTTYSQTNEYGLGFTKVSTNVFLLGGHMDENAEETEEYSAAKYFKNGVPAYSYNFMSSSIGLTSPTDYALAHYAEVSTLVVPPANEGESATITNSMNGRNWGVDNLISNNLAVTTYWTRSAEIPGVVKYVNMAGSYSIGTSITDPHVTIRPCMLLDMKYYFNENYYA